MNIDFVDLKRQNRKYKTELLSAIEKVINNANFILGSELIAFEQAFANFCKKKYCIGLNSGTDALMLALLAYGIGEGDEVITVPNSYFSTAMVMSHVGATAVFVDMDSKNYNIDVNQIEEKITKKTKAIIPVHLYGQAADMDPIVALAKKYNLTIIEDCCQAHGATYKGKRVPYTQTGAFSFYPGKNLGAFGDGGAVVTDNPAIKEKIEYLRNDGSKEKYQHKMFGYKSRLDTLQAAILLVKLKYLEEFVEKRRRAASLYNKHLQSVEGIILPKEMEYAYHAYHIYAILCDKRGKLAEYLLKNGVQTVIHYPKPIHLQGPYLQMGFKKGDFPIAEEFSEKTLSIPTFPEITDEEIQFIANKIREFYS